MKERITKNLAAILIALFGIFNAAAAADAAESETAKLIPVHITGYCLQGLTKSEKPTRAGICAFRPEDIGKTAIAYDADMNLIGIYEIEDTGGETVRAGKTLDIWCETEAECYQLTCGGYVLIVEAEG